MATGGGDAGASEQQESQEEHEQNIKMEGLTKAFGACKWFNAAKGYGFVSFDEAPKTEDGKEAPDIFVYQSSIKMPGFRNLADGEKVEVWYKKSSKGLEAVEVSGPCGADCKGSEKRPKRRKKTGDRCYNCDQTGHHCKECNMPPLPKRCHHCKKYTHLVADCPTKDKKSVTSQPSQSSEQKSESVVETSQRESHQYAHLVADCPTKEKSVTSQPSQSSEQRSDSVVETSQRESHQEQAYLPQNNNHNTSATCPTSQTRYS